MRPAAKSPVAKSPVAKSPVAKSPVAKYPVVKYPAATSLLTVVLAVFVSLPSNLAWAQQAGNVDIEGQATRLLQSYWQFIEEFPGAADEQFNESLLQAVKKLNDGRLAAALLRELIFQAQVANLRDVTKAIPAVLQPPAPPAKPNPVGPQNSPVDPPAPSTDDLLQPQGDSRLSPEDVLGTGRRIVIVGPPPRVMINGPADPKNSPKDPKRPQFEFKELKGDEFGDFGPAEVSPPPIRETTPMSRLPKPSPKGQKNNPSNSNDGYATGKPSDIKIEFDEDEDIANAPVYIPPQGEGQLNKPPGSTDGYADDNSEGDIGQGNASPQVSEGKPIDVKLDFRWEEGDKNAPKNSPPKDKAHIVGVNSPVDPPKVRPRPNVKPGPRVVPSQPQPESPFNGPLFPESPLETPGVPEFPPELPTVPVIPSPIAPFPNPIPRGQGSKDPNSLPSEDGDSGHGDIGRGSISPEPLEGRTLRAELPFYWDGVGPDGQPQSPPPALPSPRIGGVAGSNPLPPSPIYPNDGPLFPESPLESPEPGFLLPDDLGDFDASFPSVPQPEKNGVGPDSINIRGKQLSNASLPQVLNPVRVQEPNFDYAEILKRLEGEIVSPANGVFLPSTINVYGAAWADPTQPNGVFDSYFLNGLSRTFGDFGTGIGIPPGGGVVTGGGLIGGGPTGGRP